MKEPVPRHPFYDLFEAFVRDGLVGPFKNIDVQMIAMVRYNNLFSIWLQENKGLKPGDHVHYESLINEDMLIEFLNQEDTENQILMAKEQFRKKTLLAKRGILPVTDTTAKTGRGNEQIPLLFSELFKNTKLVDSCLALLREIEPAAINDENCFIGKNKGILTIWFTALEHKGLFKVRITDDDIRADILNANVKNLNISGSLFRTDRKRAKEYQREFEALISSLNH